jgi:hypothetical protein
MTINEFADLSAPEYVQRPIKRTSSEPELTGTHNSGDSLVRGGREN